MALGVTSIFPYKGKIGTENLQVTVKGTDFVSGAEVTFSPSTNITVNDTTYVDENELTVDVSIPESAPVERLDLIVTLPSLATVTASKGFIISQFAQADYRDAFLAVTSEALDLSDGSNANYVLDSLLRMLEIAEDELYTMWENFYVKSATRELSRFEGWLGIVPDDTKIDTLRRAIVLNSMKATGVSVNAIKEAVEAIVGKSIIIVELYEFVNQGLYADDPYRFIFDLWIPADSIASSEEITLLVNKIKPAHTQFRLFTLPPGDQFTWESSATPWDSTAYWHY